MSWESEGRVETEPGAGEVILTDHLTAGRAQRLRPVQAVAAGQLAPGVPVSAGQLVLPGLPCLALSSQGQAPGLPVHLVHGPRHVLRAGGEAVDLVSLA